MAIAVDGDVIDRLKWHEPLPVDSGSHGVTASAPGCESFRVTVQVDQPADGNKPPPKEVEIPKLSMLKGHVAAIVIGGVGVAGLVSLAVTGGLAAKKAGDLREACGNALAQCTDGKAPASGSGTDPRALKQEGVDWATAANVTLVVSLGVITTGVLAWVLTPSPSKPKSTWTMTPVVNQSGVDCLFIPASNVVMSLALSGVVCPGGLAIFLLQSLHVLSCNPQLHRRPGHVTSVGPELGQHEILLELLDDLVPRLSPRKVQEMVNSGGFREARARRTGRLQCFPRGSGVRRKSIHELSKLADVLWPIMLFEHSHRVHRQDQSEPGKPARMNSATRRGTSPIRSRRGGTPIPHRESRL